MSTWFRKNFTDNPFLSPMGLYGIISTKVDESKAKKTAEEEKRQQEEWLKQVKENEKTYSLNAPDKIGQNYSGKQDYTPYLIAAAVVAVVVVVVLIIKRKK